MRTSASVDEPATFPIDTEGARLLFQVSAAGQEQRRLIVTADVEFSAWGTVFGYDNLVAAGFFIPRLRGHPPGASSTWQCGHGRQFSGAGQGTVKPRSAVRLCVVCYGAVWCPVQICRYVSCIDHPERPRDLDR
jgi:hypothetical protein